MAGERLAKLIAENQRTPYVKTAFDLAVEHGFRGSVADWLESLRGARGEKGGRGDDGVNGKAGDQGPRGPQGPKGDQGEIGPMPRHEWKGTELRFEVQPGEWGPYVDLKGPKGDAALGGGAVLVVGNSYMPSGW